MLVDALDRPGFKGRDRQPIKTIWHLDIGDALGGIPTVRQGHGQVDQVDQAGQVQENCQSAAQAPVRKPELDGNVSAGLLEALSGRDANRDRATAFRTRRVVMGSLGVLKEHKQDKSRARAMALAVTLVLLLLITPLIWEATDSLIGGEHLGDAGNSWSLWACLVCPTLLGAALVAGWWRRRS
jgi:hypothetical protein